VVVNGFPRPRAAGPQAFFLANVAAHRPARACFHGVGLGPPEGDAYDWRAWNRFIAWTAPMATAGRASLPAPPARELSSGSNGRSFAWSLPLFCCYSAHPFFWPDLVLLEQGSDCRFLYWKQLTMLC